MSTATPGGLEVPTQITCPGVTTGARAAADKSPASATAGDGDNAEENFQVGERVWVYGNKPCCIQFLGETQFAPGQWAGIVLEEPFGTNDGSVAGVRYFQCDAFKGIFTRPSKLSRTEGESNGTQAARQPALPNTSVGSVASQILAAKSPLPSTAVKKASAPSTSATPSNLARTNSQFVSNPSESGSVKKGESELVGGTKAGVIHCLGETDFAKGVELDKRYQPKHGQFASVRKVTRVGPPSTTPAKAKTPAWKTTMTPSTSSTPSGLKRSTTSSVTSSVGTKSSRTGLLTETPSRYNRKSLDTTALQEALQELLKEKQQDIEQLIAERDMDRAEMAIVTSQAREMKQEITLLRDDREEVRTEMEATMGQLRALIEAADKDKVDLLNQLEERRRQIEDLQFQVDEACITKEDLEMQTRRQHVYIKVLEQNLLFKKTKAVTRQRPLEDTRAATVSERSRLMDRERRSREVSDLQLPLSSQQDFGEQSSATSPLLDEIGALRDQLASQENKQREEINGYKEKLEAQEQAHGEAAAQLQMTCIQLLGEKEQLQMRLNQAETKNNATLDLWRSKLESAVSSHQQLMEELKLLFSNGTDAQTVELIETKTALGKLKLEYKSFVEESEARLKAEVSSRTQETDALKAQLSTLTEENERLNEEMQYRLEWAEEEYMELMNEVLDKFFAGELRIKQLEEKEEALTKQAEDKDRETEEKMDVLCSKAAQSRQALGTVKEKLEEKLEEIQSQHWAKVGELNFVLEAKEKEVLCLQQSLSTFEQQKDDLHQELGNLKQNMYELTEEHTKALKTMQETSAKLSQKEEQCTSLSAQTEALRHQLTGLERKLKSADEKLEQLSKEKCKLEKDISDMMKESGDSSEQFAKMNEELMQKDGRLEELQGLLSEQKERVAQLNEQLQQETAKKEQQFKETIEKHQIQINSIQEKIKSLEKMVQLEDSLKKSLSEASELHTQDLETVQDQGTQLKQELGLSKEKREELRSYSEQAQMEKQTSAKALQATVEALEWNMEQFNGTAAETEEEPGGKPSGSPAQFDVCN